VQRGQADGHGGDEELEDGVSDGQEEAREISRRLGAPMGGAPMRGAPTGVAPSPMRWKSGGLDGSSCE
jgi:hypothetical protein